MSAVIEAEPTSQPPRLVRKYSQDERAQAVALYDKVGNLEKTSEVLGIPLSTLAGWVNGSVGIDSELRSKNTKELARKFESAAHHYLDLAAKKAKKAPFNHLMTAAGIAVDKMQLLNGDPTSISQNTMSEEERQVKMAEIFSRLEQKAITAQPQRAEVVSAELAPVEPEQE